MYLLVLLSGTFGTGGIQRTNRLVCLALGRWAEERGHRVRFLSLHDGAQVSGDDQKYLADPASFFGFEGSRARLAKAVLREAGRRPDLVYVTHTQLGPLAAALRAVLPSLPMGVATYGIDVWNRLPRPQLWALQQADFVTAISRDTSAFVTHLQGVPESKVHLLPPVLDPFWVGSAGSDSVRLPGASLPVLHGPDHMDRANPGLSRERTLLSVARLAVHDRDKGIDQVLCALPAVREQVPNVRYLVVGDGGDRSRLCALAQELGVGDCVQFMGEVTEESLVACYRDCDLFVLPSRKEGFGIVFLEAMAFRKAVIGGAHGGSPEVIADGESGLLVEHGDNSALREAMVRLLLDDELRQRMGRAGYERLCAQFRFEEFEKTLIALVEEHAHAIT